MPGSVCLTTPISFSSVSSPRPAGSRDGVWGDSGRSGSKPDPTFYWYDGGWVSTSDQGLSAFSETRPYGTLKDSSRWLKGCREFRTIARPSTAGRGNPTPLFGGCVYLTTGVV